MAFVSLFSCPPNPVLDKIMTDSELAGDEREDGELEDGEIDDEGIEMEENEKETNLEPEVVEKEKVREKEDKANRHSHKRHKKIREKQKSKRRRRDRQKHHSPSSDSSSHSYDSDYEHQDRSKGKRNKSCYQDYDGQFANHEHEHSGAHGKPPRSSQCKKSENEETYNYNEHQDDFIEELSKYKQAKDLTTSSQTGPPKEHVNRQPFIGMRGRGRGGGGLGKGHGALSKNKKQKGKNWGRGRGRGGEHGESGEAVEAKPFFQKKRPIMSQEFISQHTVEHNGRNICKYFIEGRCIKGDQCKFEHDNVVPEKKKELCKFYVQGFCTKGENCIYMHNEYPCKFFHTGAKCYQGDNCKFSHDPLNEVTKELLDKILNTDEDHAHEDELELEDLKKQGIAPLPKPPPGVGLLPTPGGTSPQDGSKKIPSLFEIKVQPTVDLAQKIALRPSFYNSTSPPPGQYLDSGSSAQFIGSPEDIQIGDIMSSGHIQSSLPPPPGSMSGLVLHFPGPGFPQSPPRPPPHGFGQGPPMPPSILPGQPPIFHGNLQQINHQNLNPKMNQQGASFERSMKVPFKAVDQMPSEFFKSLFSSQSLGLGAEGLSRSIQDSQQSSAEFHSGMQDLLPAVQKALLLQLNQNQQDADTHIPEETTNWYSSDEEDSSSVTAILKTLKKQNEMTQQAQHNLQQSGTTPVSLTDPRLHKECAQSNDPRVKIDHQQQIPDTRKELDADVDPRLFRNPHKIKSMGHIKIDPQHHFNPVSSKTLKTPIGEEDDDGERELKEKAALIPLEPSPGVMLLDPRCQVKQFSHIRVDILLQRPAFAHSVVWAPEDLVPSFIPKQEHSINLPLPPLIAGAQLNRSLSSPPDQPPYTTLTPLDPRLATARLKDCAGRLGSPPGRALEPRLSTEKPTDPRTQKMLDPRISRTGSLDSKLPTIREFSSGGEIIDPRLQRSTVENNSQTAADSEKLPPYAPNLSSSITGVMESPTTLLGGISLYDPRNHILLSPKRDAKDPHKKARHPKQPQKHKNFPPPQTSSPLQATAEKKNKASYEDSDSQTRGCEPGQLVPTATQPLSTVPCSPVNVAAPAMHNLPIPTLTGLIRPAYTDPRQNRTSGQATEMQGEDEEESKEKKKKDRPLRDVFKTFDPTASPFCQ